MVRIYLLTAAVAATFLAGCAPMDNKVTSEAAPEKSTVTGSRLPVRDSGQSSATVESAENKGGYVAPGNINIQPTKR